MGSMEHYPRQGAFINKPCIVSLQKDGPVVPGLIIRDDIENPFITIIKLVDGSGRIVLATECAYHILSQKELKQWAGQE